MMNAPTEPVTHLPLLVRRARDSHKGDFGRALLVGGSRGMSGAIALAGLAALRGGAGLVRLAVPAECLATVAGFEPSYMTAPLPADEAGRLLATAADPVLDAAPEATCVACGPGLGRSIELVQLVARLYTELPQPLVLDADALTALAAVPAVWTRHAGPRILTPHPGEFRRLVGSLASTRAEQEVQACDWARSGGVVLVLKGSGTLVTDGRRVYRNSTGNPGLATGGSGDVLTGLITALVCQGLAPFEAAQLGVYLHGRAGDLGAAVRGEVSLIASDLLGFLPDAIQGYQRETAEARAET